MFDVAISRIGYARGFIYQAILTFLVCSPVWGASSEAKERIGLPRLLNYSSKDYKASNMNWCIIQGQKGEIYLGNNYGLLRYNGKGWEHILETSNRTRITALGQADDKREIYIGAENEIGYIVRNVLGQVNYKSLNPLIPQEHQNYGIVRKAIVIGAKVYFFTSHRLFIYHDREMDVIHFDEEIVFISEMNGMIYLQKKNHPLEILQDNLTRMVPGTEGLADFELRTIWLDNGYMVLLTYEHGLYRLQNGTLKHWKTNIGDSVAPAKVNTGAKLSGGQIAIGTIRDGVFISNSEGKSVIHIDSHNGLQNNSIHHIFEDNHKNLWLALGKGVSYLELSSDFYYIDARLGLDGSVYDCEIQNKKLYIATNQGVFCGTFQDGNITPLTFLPGTEAHTWSLTPFEGKFLLGNHLGGFEIDRDVVKPMNMIEKGAWQFLNPPDHSNILIQGSYAGIFKYVKHGSNWKVEKKYKGFSETARQMLFDEKGRLWISHGLHGIYRIDFDSKYDLIKNVKLYTKHSGLPENSWNFVFFVDDEVLIGTQRGVYRFEEGSDTMIPDREYQRLLGGDRLIRQLIQLETGDIVFVKGLDNEDEVGLINRGADHDPVVNTFPFQRLKGELIPAFETVTQYNDQIFFGSKDGMIIYNENLDRNQINFHTTIDKVYCSQANDSIIYGHPSEFDPVRYPEGYIQKLPFKLNAIKITFAASFFEQSNKMMFRSKLEGFDGDWTHWSESTSRSFTNLREGDYTFRVESRNIYGSKGIEDSFRFSIAPPWYRSGYMFFSYFILFMLSIVGVLLIRRRQIVMIRIRQERELVRQRAEYDRKNLEVEQQMTQLQMEKLKSEVEFKSRELASSTLHLAQQNDTVLKAIERIEAINTIKDVEAKTKLKEIVGSLKEMISEESNWEQFELHFNEIHDNFIKRLKSEFPHLTARDIRLCAYLRMNLASKEIAPLMGISYRGVEALRYRIRKKLQLKPEDNLTDFILGF